MEDSIDIIDLNGESNDLAVEKGGVLNNFVGEVSGEITKNTRIDFCDYWYDGAEPLCCRWNVLPDDHTLDVMGQNITVMAAAFSPAQVQAALNASSTWGEEPNVHTVNTYMAVIASDAETENGSVTLDDIHVGPYQTLILKEWVDVGDEHYHNATYNLSGISFGDGAGLVIKGAPTVNIGENVNYNYLIANEGAVISGNGYVHSAEQLEAALLNGGNIYLYPFAMEDRHKEEFTFEDGHTETVYETQYRIASDEPYAISKDTNLISLGGGDPMAVFFDGGFTVAEGKPLKFNGLNVVAAADSTVNGRVEVCNGILVVQTNSQNGATLTNLGTIQVGNPNCDGKLAIFPKLGENGEPMFENAE